jgi:hypothetical protein
VLLYLDRSFFDYYYSKEWIPSPKSVFEYLRRKHPQRYEMVKDRIVASCIEDDLMHLEQVFHLASTEGKKKNTIMYIIIIIPSAKYYYSIL